MTLGLQSSVHNQTLASIQNPWGTNGRVDIINLLTSSVCVMITSSGNIFPFLPIDFWFSYKRHVFLWNLFVCVLDNSLDTWTLILDKTFSILKEGYLTSAQYDIQQLWRTYFDTISFIKSNFSQLLINPSSPSFNGSIVQVDKSFYKLVPQIFSLAIIVPQPKLVDPKRFSGCLLCTKHFHWVWRKVNSSTVIKFDHSFELPSIYFTV